MKITFDFVAGECNGLFNIKIINQNEYVFDTLSEGKNIISIDAIAGDLIIEFTGKNSSRDTIINNGEITKDKFINFESITINGFKLERYHLFHHFFNPYISKNCIQKLTLPTNDNLLYWYAMILENHAAIDQEQN